MFSKQEYWKNRKAGKRGQGAVNTVVRYHATVDWPKKAVSKKALRKNTKRARAAV